MREREKKLKRRLGGGAGKAGVKKNAMVKIIFSHLDFILGQKGSNRRENKILQVIFHYSQSHMAKTCILAYAHLFNLIPDR